ncbi:DNA polymerase I [Oceanirhabdus sp. W0125-5]|uniref:DNA polymerase I n=1 Tax=Oceanirhabdus sp. W0125-5 TaxID=2999116 RepID=UPI0022F316A1|nr:DNA polymerase I [Oceanirhabdus sp. W0125-5]WBW95882.1 DNA polymerase I [Oceanirhabdus sp. W0125-5]
MERIVILDCNSLMYRAFYGLPPLTNSEGLTTNAIYGISTMLFKIKEEFEPKYIAAAFDRKAPTFRHIEYKEYKAGRKKMPPELAEQIPYIKEFLENFGAAKFEIDGFEADDIIGTIARKAESEGKEVYIVTGDKDALQLASDNIKVVINKKGMTQVEVYDRERIIQDIGVTPTEFIDVKGLMGDKSDNIPGVPGVGEKTAIKLIQEYHTVENILENLDKVKAKKLNENLTNYAEQAIFSKKLATINTEVPIGFTMDEMDFEKNRDISKLREMFYKFQFKSLISKIGDAPVECEEITVEAKDVDTIDGLKKLTASIQKEDTLFILHKVENDNKFTELELVDLHVSDGETIYHVDVKGILNESREDAIEELRKIFSNDLNVVGHEVKHLYTALRKLGIEDFLFSFDCEIAAYLIDPGKKGYSLESLIEGHLHKGINGDNKEIELIHYLSEIYTLLKNKAEELDINKLLYEIEIPLTKVISDMEFEGFRVDSEMLKELGEKFNKEISTTEKEIYDLCGEEFNIKSPKQLGKILFEKLDLPVIKKTKTGYSTNAEVLEKLQDKHPVIEKILFYRQITKLNSTYVEGLQNVIDEDNKIHSSFNQTVTTTGRLSSTEPNLQNIPVKYEMGREIRKVFIPEEDSIILSADYSQIELRVLAHISGDETLIDSFKNEEDIHRRTASEVFGVPMDEVTSIMRSNAKAVNFGIVYGIGDFSLAKDLNITRKEAKTYIDAYLNRYPKVKDYLDGIIEEAKKNGEVRTMLNRRRFIPELASSKKMMIAFGERLAMNTPIQGSAADIIKMAMVNVWRKLKENNLKSKVILQVHDELLLNVVKGEEEVIINILQNEMRAHVEKDIEFKVPMVIDINRGASWYEAK